MNLQTIVLFPDAILFFINFVLNSLENKNKITAIFLDLLKAFDRVVHAILFYKLECFGFRGVVLKLIKSFLLGRTQCAFCTGSFSPETEIYRGLPQGSVLAPFLFLVYNNDLAKLLSCMEVLFVDDTTFGISDVNDEDLSTQIHNIRLTAEKWFQQNDTLWNHNKTVTLNFEVRTSNENKVCAKFLDIYVDASLTWNRHVDYLINKLARTIFGIRKIRKISTVSTASTMYNAIFHSVASYGIIIWGGSSAMYRIFILPTRAIRAVAGAKRLDSSSPLFKKIKNLNFTCTIHLQ